ncbi:hypothetical protein Baya_5125 [Bagarius yarrelli]|uniref:Uncharacterized protein n=1 Tax=Bagarius yarrelli TaxID=175774 RepID=A0A556TTM9_BAGYA|nr:hypothetical protein Baya_5125 [Bagarius yarrelli]
MKEGRKAGGLEQLEADESPEHSTAGCVPVSDALTPVTPPPDDITAGSKVHEEEEEEEEKEKVEGTGFLLMSSNERR